MGKKWTRAERKQNVNAVKDSPAVSPRRCQPGAETAGLRTSCRSGSALGSETGRREECRRDANIINGKQSESSEKMDFICQH